jgi:hypothetical protein
MIKIGATIGVLAIVVSSCYAIDITYETGRDQSIKHDKSMSVKKGNEQRSNNRKFVSAADATSHSSDVSFEPVAIYMNVANECIRTVAVAADFGLSAVVDGGIIDLNKKGYYDGAASSAMKLSEIDDVDEYAIKEHLACILLESSRMAQANLILQKELGGRKFTSSEISDKAILAFKKAEKISNPFIKSQIDKAVDSLKKPCRFLPNMGKDSIQCGALAFSFVDNSIKQGGVMLTPSEKFFGVSSTLRISMSDTDTVGREVARENSESSSRDASLTNTGSNSISRGGKQQTNVAPFLPK